jgi:hypothetical protein
MYFELYLAKGNFLLIQVFAIQLFGIIHFPSFNIELIGVDPDENEEQGNEDGSEDETDKAKKPHADNNAKTGDQGMNIAQAL